MKGRAPLWGRTQVGSPRSTVQKDLSGWRDEENVVHSHNVMLFILEKVITRKLTDTSSPT